MSPPVSSDVNMTRASLPRLQLIVLLAATTILSFCSAPAGLLVNRKWTRLNSPLTSVTVITAARSVTECAEECLQCSGCVAFCKSATSPNCYLQSAGGAQVPLGDASGFKCFSIKCPASMGYEIHEGRCMKLYTASVNFENARSQCAEDLGHLYYYKDSVVDMAAVQALLSPMGSSFKYFWMGAQDNLVEGTFWWTDGSSLASDDPAWNSDEPNNMGDEDCVNLDLWRGGLNDENCETPMPFICQIDV